MLSFFLSCLFCICIFKTVLTRYIALKTIFADDTYSKPFFLTYLNTSIFILPLLGILLCRAWKLWRANKLFQVTSWKSLLQHLDSDNPQAGEQEILYNEIIDNEEGVGDDDTRASQGLAAKHPESSKLGLRGTAKLSLQFCILWVNILSFLWQSNMASGS